MPRPNGAVIWQGVSVLDGVTPISVVVTGLNSRSANGKTGDMLQTWIILRDLHPSEAVESGADSGICGDCKHRKQHDGSRSCYVRMNAPTSVWWKLQRTLGRWTPKPGLKYAVTSDLREIAALGAGREVRLGSYGDPAAVPIVVWQALVSRATGRTGYTHQARRAPSLMALAMASADTVLEAFEYQEAGWRTFRVAAPGDGERARGEARCPASVESGRVATCETCPLKCDGAAGGLLNIVIQAHGNGKNHVKRAA